MSDEIRQGIESKRLLNDPAFTRAYDSVEAALLTKMATCPIRDKRGLYELRLMLKLLCDVRANLEGEISDGKLAEEELKRQEDRRKSLIRRVFPR